MITLLVVAIIIAVGAAMLVLSALIAAHRGGDDE